MRCWSPRGSWSPRSPTDCFAPFTDRLLWLAWSFTAGLRPRSDLEYDPPPNWVRRFSRAVGGAIVLPGVALVALGLRGGGLR